MKLTWYGHSAFRIDLSGASILIDPFFTGNPGFTASLAEASAGVTHIVLTHGHGDHLGDTIPIARESGAKVIADADICSWLGRKGLTALDPMNTGGTTDQGAFRVSYTVAHHSSAVIDENGVSNSLGHPHGVVIRAEGEKTLYHSGDTDIFSDMALIDEIYQPKIGILPIGDRFTMNGTIAAMAAKRFFHFETLIPCHYATFPVLDQTPDKLLEGMRDASTRVLVLASGETVEL